MTPLPLKVTSGEIITCADRHEVGCVLETLSLAQSITAEAVAMIDGAVSEEAPGRTVCARCGHLVARVLHDGRWSVRLERGWVS